MDMATSFLAPMPFAPRGVKTFQSMSMDSSADEKAQKRAALLLNMDAETRARLGLQTEDESRVEALNAKLASFTAFDINGDGVVDVFELRTGLFEKFGTKATEMEIVEAMEEFDDNNNGVLEVEEFQLGQLKMRIEQRQDASKKAARKAGIKQRSNSESDGDEGGRGGGGGGGLGGFLFPRRAPAPVMVPVPVPVRRPNRPGEGFM